MRRLLLLLFLSGLALGQLAKRPGMSYTEETPPNRVRIVLKHLRGQARDRGDQPIPAVALGLYTEAAPHELIALGETDDGGNFDFGKKLAPGPYRLIAMYPGLCTANIPVEVNPRGPDKKLALRMEYPGLDVCSYATAK